MDVCAVFDFIPILRLHVNVVMRYILGQMLFVYLLAVPEGSLDNLPAEGGSESDGFLGEVLLDERPLAWLWMRDLG